MTIKELKQILQHYPEESQVFVSISRMDIYLEEESFTSISGYDWLHPTEFIRGLEGTSQ